MNLKHEIISNILCKLNVLNNKQFSKQTNNSVIKYIYWQYHIFVVHFWLVNFMEYHCHEFLSITELGTVFHNTQKVKSYITLNKLRNDDIISLFELIYWPSKGTIILINQNMSASWKLLNVDHNSSVVEYIQSNNDDLGML